MAPALFSRNRLVGLVSAVVVIVAVSPVWASELSDLRRERERARQAEQEALEQLDLLRVDDQAIAAALQEIDTLISAQEARVAGARQALADAEQEVLRREADRQEGAALLAAKEQELVDHAVAAFIGSEQAMDPRLMSNDVNRTARRLSFIDFAAGNDRDHVGELRALRAELEAHVADGQAARLEADQLRSELERALEIFEERRSTKAEIQAQIQVRLAEWTAEANAAAEASEEFTELIRQESSELTGLEPGSPSLRGFIMPSRGRLSSTFGPRVHPIFGNSRHHAGIDIAAPTGTAIWASKSGRVIFAGWKGGYGKTVVILHDDGGVSTLYAHLSEFHSSVGDRVDQGEIIAEMGSTGWSTGPHLHFEVRVNGVPKDPMAFLP